MARLGLIVLASLATALWVSPAQGQNYCFPRAMLIAHLESRFGEVKAGEGIADNGAAMELVTSENGATWTLFVTSTDGRSCLLASGKGWSTIPYRKPEKPS